MYERNHHRVHMICCACVAVPFCMFADSYDPFNPNPTQWDVDQARREADSARRAADDLGSLSLRVSGSDWLQVTSKRSEFERKAKEHSWNAERLEDRMWENQRQEERRRQEEEWQRQQDQRRQEEEWQRQQEQRRRESQEDAFELQENNFGQAADAEQVVFAQHNVVGAKGDARFKLPCPQPGDARTFDTWVYKVRAYWRKVGVRYSNTIDAGMVNYYNAHLGEKTVDKLMGVKPSAQVVKDGGPDPKDYKSERTFVEAYVKFKAKGSGNGQLGYQERRYFYAMAHTIWAQHRKDELEKEKIREKIRKEYCAATEEYARAIESKDPSNQGVIEAARKRYEESRRKYEELDSPFR